jgi:hypothetical protein
MAKRKSTKGQTTIYKTYTKKTRHMTLQIQVLALNRHTIMTGLNRLMGSQPFPLYIMYVIYEDSLIYLLMSVLL